MHCMMSYSPLYYMLSFFTISVSSKSSYEKLLVVSFDGFRYDYLNWNITPTLNSLRNTSTFAEYLVNVFPTQTFPNHFTLATGLYTEIHGVLANKVYDKNTKEILTDAYELWHYNKNITPIWTLNEDAAKDRHSGVMMWPGSSFEYNGVNITFKVKFSENISWKERVDEMITWFIHPVTPTNLVMLYFEEPDVDSHIYGPNSEQNYKQIKKSDNIAEYLLKELKKHNLTDVNVIFLSDHGMEGVPLKKIIDLNMFVGDEADMYGTSPVLQVYPKADISENMLFEKLDKASQENKNFKVYLKNDIPEHFYYKNCERAPPILAVAEPNFAFQDKFKSIKKYIELYNASENGIIGIHGYDPKTINMHAYFIAHGPLFKKNFSISELRTIDMFSLFSLVLGLDVPAIKPNGSVDNVKHIFVSINSSNNLLTYGIFSCLFFLIYGLYKKRKGIRKKKIAKDECLESLLMY